MSALRLVLVTRRYWPLVGGEATATANLAAGFAARGVRVTVVTPQWRRDWPTSLGHAAVRVVRLPFAARRSWGNFQYMRALAAWLRAEAANFDVAYVSQLKHDAAATLSAAARTPFPVVLRAERAGLAGDCHWQLNARFGQRIKRRCCRADALIAPTPAIEQELIAAGYPRDRIHPVPPGVPLRRPANTVARDHVRAVLAGAHEMLAIPNGAPLAVYAGSLVKQKGLAQTVKAWRDIAQRFPDARLWLLGEGPQRVKLAALVEQHGLRGRVVLPGVFDMMDDVYAAADLYLAVATDAGTSLSLLEALAAGLPAVAADIPANRQLMDEPAHGRFFAPGDFAKLVDAAGELLADPPRLAQLGAAAHEHVRQRFDIATTVERHLELFDGLAAKRMEQVCR